MLQQLDYLAFIDVYHERIKMFHVKDAEFNPSAETGRVRWLPVRGSTVPRGSANLGDGQVDFSRHLLEARRYRLSTAGPWSNGSAASSIPRTARARAPSSCSITSSGSPRKPSTTSPTPVATRPPTGACSAFIAEAPNRAGRGMAIEGSKNGKTLGRRLRLGMVGGGQGAFIGAVHRIAARLDDRYELVAGAFSGDPGRSRASAAELGVAGERAYGSLRRDGGDGGGARRRHRHRRHRDAEPRSPRARHGVPRVRNPRHLRQAADHHPRRRPGPGRDGAADRPGVRA